MHHACIIVPCTCRARGMHLLRLVLRSLVLSCHVCLQSLCCVHWCVCVVCVTLNEACTRSWRSACCYDAHTHARTHTRTHTHTHTDAGSFELGITTLSCPSCPSWPPVHHPLRPLRRSLHRPLRWALPEPPCARACDARLFAAPPGLPRRSEAFGPGP